MHSLRKLILVVSLTALAVTALAVPASAASTKGVIGVVNGIPGVRVDICVNGNEIRSNVKYGGRTFKVMFPNSKTIKVRRAGPGKCKGAQLGQKTIALAAGDDFTVVFNKIAPKAVVFDNAGLGMIPPDGPPIVGASIVTWRHAADLGAATFKVVVGNPEIPIAPAVDPVWVEGDELATALATGTLLLVRATRPDKNATIAKTPLITFGEGRRYEYYLLGRKVKNAKLIIWNRAISNVAP